MPGTILTSVKVNVIIPAAGLATRMRPLTNTVSKAMLPVNGKPCLQYILDAFKHYNIGEIVVVDGKLEDIRQRFPHLKYVQQECPTGPADAIKLGYAALLDKESPVVVWLGDTIVLDTNLPFGTDFLAVAEKPDHSEWCVTDGKTYFDKPVEFHTGFKALVGIYGWQRGRLLGSHLGDSTIGPEISSILQLHKEFKLVNVQHHFDVGNFNNYYATAASLKSLTARAMNRLKVDTFYGTIEKTSESHGDKIQKERLWYLSLNEEQRLFTPRILSGPNLKMTLEPGFPLADLLVYDQVPMATWRMLLERLYRIMEEVFWNDPRKQHLNNEAANYAMYITEPGKRILPATQHLTSWIVFQGIQMMKDATWAPVIHGDFHTGNILFEPATGKLTLVDPRGEFGVIGTAGDKMYDLYKLYQDLYHGYHFMLYGINPPPALIEIRDMLAELSFMFGYNHTKLVRGGLFLLATCLPFHADDPARQQRFLDYINSWKSPLDSVILTRNIGNG